MKKLLDKVGRKRPGGPSLVGKQIVIGSTCVRVESLLGEGGFGSIYRVREIYSGQLYAVKHLRLQGDPEAIQSVQQEARIMFKLKEYKHILRLHAVAFGGEKGAETDGYMLLDYCPNTLISMLESYNFMLDNSLIMDIFISVCEGVAHMHSLPQPLAHRDLKVENVLRLTDGTWVICDFGSATTRAQVYQTQAEIAAEEEVIRRTTTPAYRAPEMVDMLRRQRIDTKVDIWALGVMLYVLCFGKLPFQGDSKLQILYGRFEIPPGRPGFFRELIQDMLIVTPEDRPDIHAVLAKAKHYAPSLVQPGPLLQHQPLVASPHPSRHPSLSQAQHASQPLQHASPQLQHPSQHAQHAPPMQHPPQHVQHVSQPMQHPAQHVQHAAHQRQPELLVVPSQNPPPDFQVQAPVMQQPRHPGMPTQPAQTSQYQVSNLSPRAHNMSASPYNSGGTASGVHQNSGTVAQPAVQAAVQQQPQQPIRYQTLGPAPVNRAAPSAATSQSPSRQSTGDRMLSERLHSDRLQPYQSAPREMLSQESRSLHNLHTELANSNGNTPTSVPDKYSAPLSQLGRHEAAATSSSSDNTDTDDSDSPDLRTDRATYGRETSTGNAAAATTAAAAATAAYVDGSPRAGGLSAAGGLESTQRRLTGGMASTAGSARQPREAEEWADFSNSNATSNAVGNTQGAAAVRREVGGRFYPDRTTSTAAVPPDVSPLTAGAQELHPSRSPSPPPRSTAAAITSDSVSALRDSVAGDIDAIRRQLKEVVLSNQSLAQRVKSLEDTTVQQRHIIQRLQSELDSVRGSSTTTNSSMPNGNSYPQPQQERQPAGSHSRYSSFNSNHEYGSGQAAAPGQQRGGQVVQEARAGSFWGQGQNGTT